MADNKLQIVIDVDAAKGTAQLKAVGNEFDKLRARSQSLSGGYDKLSQSSGAAGNSSQRLAGQTQQVAGGMDRASSSTSSLSAAVKTLAASYAALQTAHFVQETAMLASRVETLGTVMGVVGKNSLYSREEMDAYADAVRKMGITTQESRQTVIRMAQANLDLGKAASLARLAQDAAVVANTNSSESLQGLLRGITTLQPEILRTYGIIVNFEQEYAAFAGAEGRTVDSLSAHEKQQIALNAALKAGEAIAGSYDAAMGTVNKQINSLPRLIEEAKLKVGELFTPALTVLVQEFAGELAAMDKYLQEAAANGDMKRWAQEIASGVKEGVEAFRDLIENIRTAIEIVKPFAGTAAELLVIGLVAEKALSAARGIAALSTALRIAQTSAIGLNTALNGTVPLLVFFGAYKATEWLTSWADGTTRVKQETDELSEALKRQKKTLRDAEAAAAQKRAAQRQAEEEYTKQFNADLRRLVAAEDARNAATRKTHEEGLKRQLAEDKKYLEKWDKEKELVGKTGTERELAALEEEYKAYARVVDDKIALEEMFAARRQEIELRTKNALISLYEELYRATADQRYAQAAIDAMQMVLEAKEQADAMMLDSDDAAHTLMLSRYEAYVDRVKGLIGETVDAERNAAQERADIVADSVANQPSAASSASSDNGFSLGKTYPGGTYDTVGGRVFVNDRAGAQAYEQALKSIQTTLAQVAKDTAAAAARAAAEAAQEAQRLAEEIQNAFNSSYERFQSWQQSRERETWGRDEYESEYTRLAAEFEQSQYYETSLDALDQMVDVLGEIEKIEQDALAASEALASDMRNQSESISEWLADLGTGSLAPVQSAEAWTVRYDELLSSARGMASEDVAKFLSYAQEYLSFQKSYGDEESYMAAYSSVVSAVEELGGVSDLMELLADLGLGQTETDLLAVIDAFGFLGVSVGTLKDAADDAKKAIGVKSDETDTLTGALAVLVGASDTASGADGMKKIIEALDTQLPEGVKIAKTATSGLSGTLMGTETPFSNVTDALNVMSSGVQTKVTEVSGFFGQLATNLGLTFNAGTVGSATSALTPVTYKAPSLTSAWTYDPEYGSWTGGPNYRKYILVNGTKGTMPVWYQNEWWMPPGYYDTYLKKNITTWYGTSSGIFLPSLPVNARGGITSGISIAGEVGPEWVIPTYEPERSRFLDSAPPDFWGNLGITGVQPSAPALDASALGQSIGRQVAAALQGQAASGGGEIHVHVHIDGREIGQAVADQYRQGNRSLIEQSRRVLRVS